MSRFSFFTKLVALNLFFYISCNLIECLWNIYVLLGTSFIIRNSILVCSLLPFLSCHIFIRNIHFITNYHFADVFRGVVFYRTHPTVNVFQRFFIIKRKCEYNPTSTFVISLSDILKSILASCISYLKFNPLAVNFNYLWHKINS